MFVGVYSQQLCKTAFTRHEKALQKLPSVKCIFIEYVLVAASLFLWDGYDVNIIQLQT